MRRSTIYPGVTPYRSKHPLILGSVLLSALTLGGLPAAFAQAQDPSSNAQPTPSDNTFMGADRDGDGRLSRDEYTGMSPNPGSAPSGATTPPAGGGVPATEHQATVLNHFEDHDRDGDGYITAGEFNSKTPDPQSGTP